jgi:hypothetical protein
LRRPGGRRDEDPAVQRAPLQRVVDQVADRPFQRVRVTADQRWPAVELVPKSRRLCAAIVDRLTFGGNIIETGTDSYRLRQR